MLVFEQVGQRDRVNSVIVHGWPQFVSNIEGRKSIFTARLIGKEPWASSKMQTSCCFYTQHKGITGIHFLFLGLPFWLTNSQIHSIYPGNVSVCMKPWAYQFPCLCLNWPIRSKERKTYCRLLKRPKCSQGFGVCFLNSPYHMWEVSVWELLHF